MARGSDPQPHEVKKAEGIPRAEQLPNVPEKVTEKAPSPELVVNAPNQDEIEAAKGPARDQPKNDDAAQQNYEVPIDSKAEFDAREASKKDDDQVLHESKREDLPENEEGGLRDDDQEAVYNIEKTPKEIEEQGYLQNFFECPYEYQEVIFMMVKGDQDGLRNNELYLQSQDLFNYYVQCIIEFSQQYDPTETLM